MKKVDKKLIITAQSEMKKRTKEKNNISVFFSSIRSLRR